jgi:hypothetical protein
MTSTIDSITALAAETRDIQTVIKLAAQHTRRFDEAMLMARESAEIRLYTFRIPTAKVKGLP